MATPPLRHGSSESILQPSLSLLHRMAHLQGSALSVTLEGSLLSRGAAFQGPHRSEGPQQSVSSLPGILHFSQGPPEPPGC